MKTPIKMTAESFDATHILAALERHPVLLSLESRDYDYGPRVSLYVNYALASAFPVWLRDYLVDQERVEDVSDLTGIDRWFLGEDDMWNGELDDPTTWLPEDAEEMECCWSMYYGSGKSMTTSNAHKLLTDGGAAPCLVLGGGNDGAVEVLFADSKGKRILEGEADEGEADEGEDDEGEADA